MASSDARQPADRGSALVIGLVLAMWGVFLYVYPQAATLPEWVQTASLFLALVCFIMGAITAGAGISNLKQSQFMTHVGVALALALVAYVLYFLSDRLVEQPPWSLATRIAVIPAALAAIFMFGVGLGYLLPRPAGKPSDRPEGEPLSPAVDQVAPPTPGIARFERVASALVAFVSLAAAIMALINEIRRGL
jgi:hypothetical protein